MIELIYVSRAVHRLNTAQLTTLLKIARANNTRAQITGMLLYDGFGTFLQALEGPAEAVDALFEKIKRDPRHTRVNLLWRKAITQRTFSDWQMGFRQLNEAPPNHLEGFTDFLHHDQPADYLTSHPGFALDMLNYFKANHS